MKEESFTWLIGKQLLNHVLRVVGILDLSEMNVVLLSKRFYSYANEQDRL